MIIYTLGGYEKDVEMKNVFFWRIRRVSERVSELFYFYFLWSLIRGVREVHFYSLPDHAGYYAEILGFLGAEEAAAGAAAVAAPSSSTVFSRLDALQLERVVGRGFTRAFSFFFPSFFSLSFLSLFFLSPSFSSLPLFSLCLSRALARAFYLS